MTTNGQMSRKATVAGMAIAAISASSDWTAQAIIAGLAVVAIVVQGFLDYRKHDG